MVCQNYYNKYLKYKNKYLNLKHKSLLNTYNFSLCFISDKSSEIFNKILYPEFNELLSDTKAIKKNFFPVEELKKSGRLLYSYDIIIGLIKELLFNYTEKLFVEIYDVINILYLSSDQYIDFWKKIQIQTGIPIKVFYGENFSFKFRCDNYLDKFFFIDGINVLLGCDTKKISEKLNNELNNHGKFFVGINHYQHCYSNEIIVCEKNLNLLTNEKFMEEWFQMLNLEPDVIKIIKIFHKYIQKDCDGCDRNCYIIDELSIRNKMIKIAHKIKNGIELSNKDIYFNSKQDGKLCNSYPDMEICKSNSTYENYFRCIDKSYQQILLQREEHDKKERSDAQIIRDKRDIVYKKYQETPDKTNITVGYREYFIYDPDDKLFEYFDVDLSKGEYELYFRKYKQLIFFELVNLSFETYDPIYFNDDFEIVDERGNIYTEEYDYSNS